MQNMYLWCWGETGCHICGTSKVEMLAEHTAEGSTLAYWHLGWRLIFWMKSNSRYSPSPGLLLYYWDWFLSCWALPSPTEWPERPSPALGRGGGSGEGTALSPDSTGGYWGTGVADKGQKGSKRKAQWWIWHRQKCYPGMQAGSAGVHSPDNKASSWCRACDRLPHDVRVLLSPLSLPSIPSPRHGFTRSNCCSSSGSLSPAPRDVQTTFLPADSSPHEILLLQRALLPPTFK